MKKRLITAASIVAVLIVGLLCLNSLLAPKTYSTARATCERFLKKNYEDMQEIAVELLRDGEDAWGHYKDRYCGYIPEWNAVKFEIDGQGMLGGQYWDLIYTADGVLFGESEEYFDEESDGNNIYKAERLDEHWWYFWTDYDGTDRSYK